MNKHGTALYESEELGIILIGSMQRFARFYGMVIEVTRTVPYKNFYIGQYLENYYGDFKLLPDTYSITLQQKDLLTLNEREER